MLKQKLKSGNFWISLISAIFLIVKVVAEKFGVFVDPSVYLDVVTGVCSVFVLFGIISVPSSKTIESVRSAIGLVDSAANQKVDENQQGDNSSFQTSGVQTLNAKDGCSLTKQDDKQLHDENVMITNTDLNSLNSKTLDESCSNLNEYLTQEDSLKDVEFVSEKTTTKDLDQENMGNQNEYMCAKENEFVNLLSEILKNLILKTK